MKNEIYIGDNLTVMTNPVFEKYTNKIKMIYIDPPYNTQIKKSYSDKIESNKWKSYIEERIKVSKKYLKDDGVIFISIDDNEFANLKIICDDIFGRENFVGTFITMQSQRSNAKHINTIHEYILCFAKNKSKLHKFVMKRIEIPEDKKMIDKLNHEIKKIIDAEGVNIANKKIKSIIKKYCDEYDITWLKNYSNVDENGNIFFAVDLSTPGEPREVNIPEIGLKLKPLPTRGWSSDKKFIELYKNKRLCFKDGRPYSKHYLVESEDNVPSILNFYSRQGTNDLKKLGIGNIFDTPKPVDSLKFLIRISTKKDDIVMDYFAGSGSLAQAVYEINKETNNNIKYVLIQREEKVNSKSIVYKTCEKFNITPSIDEILKFRINCYLKTKKLDKDYEVYKID